MPQTSDTSLSNKSRHSSTKERLPTETKKAVAKEIGDPIAIPILQAIGRKNCKKRVLDLSNHSCPNSRNPSLTAFQKLPSRTIPLRDFPHPLWEVAILKLETKAVGRNDCQSMQSIPPLDLSTQIQIPALVLVLRHSPSRGRNQPMNPIPMQTHVALETNLQSLSAPLGVLMSVPVTNPSSPFRMHQLCQGQLPGMNQLLAKPMFWS